MNGKLISEYSWEGAVMLIDLLEIEAQFYPMLFSISQSKQVYSHSEFFSNVILREQCSKYFGTKAFN